MDVVQIRGQREGVARLPDHRDVVEVAQRAVDPDRRAGQGLGALGVLRPDVAERQDREVSAQQVQPDSDLALRKLIVVHALLADPIVHAGIDTGVEVDDPRQMRRGEHAGVLEGHAEIEDVGMRIEAVLRGIDRLRAHGRDELAELHVHAAFADAGHVHAAVGLDDIELVRVMDHAVELIEQMREPRVRPIHDLGLEPEVPAGRLGIERPLRGQHELVQHRSVRVIVEQPAEVPLVVGIVDIAGDAGLDVAREFERVGPGSRRRGRGRRLIGGCRLRLCELRLHRSPLGPVALGAGRNRGQRRGPNDKRRPHLPNSRVCTLAREATTLTSTRRAQG